MEQQQGFKRKESDAESGEESRSRVILLKKNDFYIVFNSLSVNRHIFN